MGKSWSWVRVGEIAVGIVAAGLIIGVLMRGRR